MSQYSDTYSCAYLDANSHTKIILITFKENICSVENEKRTTRGFI